MVGNVHTVDWTRYHDVDWNDQVRTGVKAAVLRELGLKATAYPDGFTLHRQVQKIMDDRRKMAAGEMMLDWGFAETLAYATLLDEGYEVRITGQDSGRGTFFHRHAVGHDQKTGASYVPLKNLKPGQPRFRVTDSLLSEEAVLGFEYGYSTTDPNCLVIWEGQFGDFANGAQVIIDQFIASAETKWLRMSGLVMLLPHGYEGQGPEHSSARVERYLQLCAEDNIQVCNCTTPANYFHALRRQIRRNFRKPLVVFSPKSLLRHKLAVSPLVEFGPGTRFQRLIPEIDPLVPDAKVRRIVFCTGKVYYDLLQERRNRGLDDVAIVRVEQLYPWPRLRVIEQCTRYANAELVWCQEEPANMGPWTFVLPRLINILEELHRPALPAYVGRAAAASPATGLLKMHQAEQSQLVDRALAVPLAELPQPFRRVVR